MSWCFIVAVYYYTKAARKKNSYQFIASSFWIFVLVLWIVPKELLLQGLASWTKNFTFIPYVQLNYKNNRQKKTRISDLLLVTIKQDTRSLISTSYCSRNSIFITVEISISTCLCKTRKPIQCISMFMYVRSQSNKNSNRGRKYQNLISPWFGLLQHLEICSRLFLVQTIEVTNILVWHHTLICDFFLSILWRT